MKKRQMVRPVSLLSAGLAVLLTGGCATIVGGTDQPISVDARSPDGRTIAGANCTLQNAKGVWHLTTPGTVMIHRAYGDVFVSCKKSNGSLGATTASSTTRGWMFGNLVFWGLFPIGVGVDIGTGAGYDYPNVITVLGESQTPSFANSPSTMPDGGSYSEQTESELPTVQRNVASGVETMVAAHADWDKLCKTDGPAPTIKLLDTSQHGKVEIKQGEFIAPGSHSPAECPSGKIYGTQITYASNVGFHGADHIRYEVDAESGRFTRAIEIAVK